MFKQPWEEKLKDFSKSFHPFSRIISCNFKYMFMKLSIYRYTHCTSVGIKFLSSVILINCGIYFPNQIHFPTFFVPKDKVVQTDSVCYYCINTTLTILWMITSNKVPSNLFFLFCNIEDDYFPYSFYFKFRRNECHLSLTRGQSHHNTPP